MNPKELRKGITQPVEPKVDSILKNENDSNSAETKAIYPEKGISYEKKKWPSKKFSNEIVSSIEVNDTQQKKKPPSKVFAENEYAQ